MTINGTTQDFYYSYLSTLQSQGALTDRQIKYLTQLKMQINSCDSETASVLVKCDIRELEQNAS